MSLWGRSSGHNYCVIDINIRGGTFGIIVLGLLGHDIGSKYLSNARDWHVEDWSMLLDLITGDISEKLHLLGLGWPIGGLRRGAMAVEDYGETTGDSIKSSCLFHNCKPCESATDEGIYRYRQRRTASWTSSSVSFMNAS